MTVEPSILTLKPLRLALPLMILSSAGLAIPADQSAASEEVRAKLSELVQNGNTPGLQYIHTPSPGGAPQSFETGLRDVKNGSPVEPFTTFMGFSITKTFTALAILQLADQKKLTLDEPIAKYLGDFPYDGNPTIRQVLNHTGGFPNPIPLAWSHLEAEHTTFDRPAFIRKVVSENHKLSNSPGTKFAYSNIGYLLLGQVIERASGQTYEEYVQKNIIDRLGMKPGEVVTFQYPNKSTHATGYLKRFSLLNLALGWLIDRDRLIAGQAEGWVYFQPYYVNGSAYGGLFANAPGLNRYLQSLVDPSGAFNKYANEITATGKDTRIGTVNLGWYRGSLNGNAYFAHAGGGGGFYCEIRFYPQTKRTSVIMMNRTGVSNENLLDEIDRPYFK